MNEEMIGKLRNAKSKEEVQAITKEYGEELNMELAEGLWRRLNAADGELSDDEMEAVAGGMSMDIPVWMLERE